MEWMSWTNLPRWTRIAEPNEKSDKNSKDQAREIQHLFTQVAKTVIGSFDANPATFDGFVEGVCGCVGWHLRCQRHCMTYCSTNGTLIRWSKPSKLGKHPSLLSNPEPSWSFGRNRCLSLAHTQSKAHDLTFTNKYEGVEDTADAQATLGTLSTCIACMESLIQRFLR